MASCFNDTSIKLQFDRSTKCKSSAHDTQHSQHIVFEYFSETNVCSEWLLLCELLTWRQLYRFFSLFLLSFSWKVFWWMCISSNATQWQMTSTWIYKALIYQHVVSVSHTFNDTWHFAYANFWVPIFRKTLPFMCFLLRRWWQIRSYQMNNIFKQYHRKTKQTVFALHSFRAAAFFLSLFYLILLLIYSLVLFSIRTSSLHITFLAHFNVYSKA